LNQEAIVVSDLPNMLIAAGGALRKIESDVNIEATPLLHSSQAAGLIDPLIMRFSQTAEDISDQFQATEEAYVLAYRMSGAFKSAFSDGPPEGVENADHLAQAKARSTVVVVADTDLLWDQYAYHLQNFFGRIVATPQNGNSMFAHNVAENLTGSRDLIGLRSRGMGDRPFEVIEKKLREAQAKYRETKEELDRQEREIITKLDQLQQSTSDTGVLNSALIEERKNLKRKQAETSRKLRELSRLLREDVEKLTFWLKFLNIGLMPFMVIVAGLLVAGIRIAQRKRHAANQQ
jgi:ABC-type uncharacterized transport system involved in gliding motility auxiliary subunit